jgi:type VI secretion system protein ImpH
LRPAMNLNFPNADVVEVAVRPEPESGPSQPHYTVTAAFMGLYGVDSPLPSFFTEMIHDQEEPEAVRVRDFLDIFHHRLLSLLYRAWAKYRYEVQFLPGGQDDFSDRLKPLTGWSQAVDFSAVPRIQLLRCLGLLTQQPRSAAGLASLLTDFIADVPVRVVQCIHRWISLQPDQKNSLGRNNALLGINCLAGGRVADRSGKFRLIFGPMGYESLLKLIPNGTYFALIVGLTRLYLLDPLDFEMEMVLRREEAPLMRLCDDAPNFLGWTTWLVDGPGDDVSVTFQCQPRG